MLHHIVGKVARCILATAILHRVTYQVQVFLQIDIEWWYCPVALRHLGLLFHTQHSHVLIQFHDTCPLQLLYRMLFMAHDTRCPFGTCKVHKLLEREEQQIIRCNNEQIIIDVKLIHCKQQVADCTQTSLIRLCTIIYNGYWFVDMETFL